MLKMSGDEAIHIITGTAYNGENTERHAWNLVKIEDKYYYLDATWDATLHGDIDDKVDNMTYFLKSLPFRKYVRLSTLLSISPFNATSQVASI